MDFSNRIDTKRRTAVYVRISTSMGLQAILTIKVFDYPFDVEVGDGLHGRAGLEPQPAQKFDDICQSDCARCYALITYAPKTSQYVKIIDMDG